MYAPQSLLFRAERLPHYINRDTRADVLRVYRRLHRALSRIVDPLASAHLKQRAQHSFAAYKYVTGARRIRALLAEVVQRELCWAEGAAQLEPRPLQKTLQLAFSTYKVKETPLKRVLVAPPRLCDHSSLAYRLNNVQAPRSRSFSEHVQQKQENYKARARGKCAGFWTLMHLLRANNVSTGANGRKLVFEPEDCHTSILTVFGAPVAPSRQANILRSMYSTLLRDAPRPVHPEVLRHLEVQLASPVCSRVYRRRLQQCAQSFWSVDPEGKMYGLSAAYMLAAPQIAEA